MDDRSAAPAPQAVRIDGYTDLVRIGAGGFSVVYRAHEVALNRNVAVKVLNAGLVSEQERRLFERECKALGQLDHPDIVRVYRSAYTADDRPCIVMELYDGNFREVLDQTGVLPAVTLLDLGVRMAVALHIAHSKNVLHRDVKPHNIFRSRYGDPALGDFGIATVIGERTHSAPGGLSVAYAAPELLEEGQLGPATDVYALAATLYHLATGAPPFAAKELRQAVRKILTEEAPPIRRADLPVEFDVAVHTALAKAPADRPRGALAFAEMLRDVQARSGHPVTALKLEQAGTHAARAGQGVTVLAPTGTSASGSGRRRRMWIAAGALAVVAGGVAVGVAATGSDDHEATATTVGGAVPPPDSFYDAIPVPTAVTVVAGPAAGTFTVDIAPVDGAVRYSVTVAGTDDPPHAVEASTPSLVLDGGGAAHLCVLVQAVAANGRLSPESAPFCA